MTTPSGLWAEGDSLTPTNLNRRNPVGTFPAKTYHVAWAAGTGTTQINNAIVNAAAGGYNAVFLDASRLPYDASLVTFNNAVHMLREGGPTDLSFFDVEAYGASTGPSWSGLQAARDAAAAAGGIVLHAANKSYQTEKPLWTKRGTRLLGGAIGQNAGYGNSTIQATYIGGTSELVADATASIPGLTTGLVGGGNAWTMDQTRWFDLRECKTLELDGLSQLCVEAFVRVTSTAGLQFITASSGSWFPDSDGTPICFFLRLNAGKPELFVTTSVGGGHTVTGATTLSINTTYYLRGNYDGSNLRIFFATPGGVETLDGTTAATGTLSQNIAEDVTYGPPLVRTPNRNILGGPLIGVSDSLRIRNTAGATTAGTAPSAKLTVDANTLVLANLDLNIGPLTRMQTKDGDFWSLCHYNSNPVVSGVLGWAIEGMTYRPTVAGTAGGVHIGPNCNTGLVRRCDLEGCRYGLVSDIRDSYDWEIDHLTIGNGGVALRYGLVLAGNAGIATVDTVFTFGCVVPFLCTASSVVFRNCFAQVLTADTIFGFVLNVDGSSGSPHTLIKCIVSTEAGLNAGFRAPIGVGAGIDVSGVQLIGGAYETGNNGPHILAESGTRSIEALGTSFKLAAGSTSILKLISGSTLARQAFFDGACNQIGTWIPWSDTTGITTLGRLGALYSTSTGSTILFDASVADEWDLTLSSDVTQSNWTKISYGQPVSGAIKMDSTGSRLFVWPTNSKGTATLSYGSAAVNTFTGFYDGVNVILTSVRTGL